MTTQKADSTSIDLNKRYMGKTIIFIGLGSFIGGVLRFIISQTIQSKVEGGFPIGTLIVNVVGCLLIGIVFGLYERGLVSDQARLFLATGILGGFTTFSAFSNETVALMRLGQPAQALGYVALSIVAGLTATYIGLQVHRLA